MRLRDWPPRRIAIMWVIGTGVQLLALWLVPPLMGWEYAGRDQPEPLATTAPAVPAEIAAESRATVTRTPLPDGGTLVRISRDSSYVEARMSGDTVLALDASPDVIAGAASVGQSFARILVDIERAVFTLLALIFAIPLVLSSITLAWWVQRRRHKPGAELAR